MSVDLSSGTNSVCRFLMGLEAGALGKAFPTLCTLIGLFPTVHHGVSYEIALLGETPPTLQTAKWLLPGMTPQVFFELTEPHEAFGAVRTAESPLSHTWPPRGPHSPH